MGNLLQITRFFVGNCREMDKLSLSPVINQIVQFDMIQDSS